MSIPPPRGMSEVDYDAIEAAVTETVRGRWFLAEFARRNRMAETRQLLDAMTRLEAVVAAGQAALPSADPSIRLLVQRIKEIAAGLGGVADDMRAAGVAERFVEAVDIQARAVSGMMRGASPALGSRPPAPGPRLPPADRARGLASPLAPPPTPPLVPKTADSNRESDPRLAAFAGLDALPMTEKLALFR